MITQPARRKMQTIPGLDCTVEERDAAIALYNAYHAACARHDGRRSAFITELGGLKADRHTGRCNIEDQPRAGSMTKSQRYGSGLWIRLAKLVLQRRMDPGRFIRAQFLLLPAGGASPSPQAFFSPEALLRYRDADALGSADIAAAFEAQHQIAEREIVVRSLADPRRDRQGVWVDVLSDDDIGLSGLFRYCLAAGVIRQLRRRSAAFAAFEDIMGQYRIPAVLQFMDSPQNYAAIWGDWIPRGFSASAPRIHGAFHQSKTSGDWR